MFRYSDFAPAVMSLAVALSGSGCSESADGPPGNADAPSMRILFLGHLYPVLESNTGRDLLTSLGREQASMIVFGGDSVVGDDRNLLGREFTDDIHRVQWRLFDEFAEAIDGSRIVIPGNHDLLFKKEDQGRLMRDAISARNPFPLFWGKLKLHACSGYFLNTVDQTGTRAAYQLDAVQFNWLVNSLGEDLANSTPCTILFLHHRLWAMKEYTSSYAGGFGQFSKLEPILKKFPKAVIAAGDLGLMGVHHSGNMSFFDVSNMVGRPGYLRIDLYDGGLRAELVKID